MYKLISVILFQQLHNFHRVKELIRTKVTSIRPLQEKLLYGLVKQSKKGRNQEQ